MSIWRLPPERFFPAMAKLAKLFRCPIDLIDLDETSPFTRYLKTTDGALSPVGWSRCGQR